jgi:hypothetical protein
VLLVVVLEASKLVLPLLLLLLLLLPFILIVMLGVGSIALERVIKPPVICRDRDDIEARDEALILLTVEDENRI